MDDNPSTATSLDRELTLLTAPAFCAIIAAFAGLVRLVWDLLHGVASPPWLPEWSVMSLAGGVAIDMALQSWRRHPGLALTTIALASALYFGGRFAWLEVLDQLHVNVSSISASPVRALVALCALPACCALQRVLGYAAGIPYPLPDSPRPRLRPKNGAHRSCRASTQGQVR